MEHGVDAADQADCDETNLGMMRRIRMACARLVGFGAEYLEVGISVASGGRFLWCNAQCITMHEERRRGQVLPLTEKNVATKTKRRRRTPEATGVASTAAAKAVVREKAGKVSARSGPALGVAAQGRSKTTLQTRMTEEQKRVILEAAENRQIAVSEYVRMTVCEQAKRELEAAAQHAYCLTATEQAALWKALHAPVKLTEAQKRLSRLMRGEE